MRSRWTDPGARGPVRRLQLLARPRRPEPLPVQFDRRRTYVLPTAFGLFFLILLVTMGVGALNYNNNPALLLALMLAGTALASLIAAHLQLSGLAVHAVSAEPVAAGKPLLLRVHLRADPRRPRRGLLVETEAATARISLDRGGGEAALEIPTVRRGWLSLDRIRISTTRPLGLARAWSWVWPQEPLLVYPASEPDGPPLPLGAGDNAQARMHPAGDDLHHLRTWRSGDSRRAIAWKPSARRDVLLVREYEEPQGADIVLDWSALESLPAEARIRRLARWIDEAERDQRRYQLLLPGHQPMGPASGPAHRHACLRALALLPGAEAA
ncbi:DUF58 domain-containing protein [Luteimonas sp. MJ293]|uniref:DUF58 domain-containing protein n=1 Tax=Luteimonas sp. MJ146 TaxID=3129240 RepID=UPI0031BB12A1